MGVATSCTCSDDKKYRFKGFIVSVYPDKKNGALDEDALGKLNSYVGSNPERIPRVCRKVTKILRRDLYSKHEDRVMVSVAMLRSLIEHSKVVDGFVPHGIEICAQLLSTNVARYHVGAADVLTVLCHRLGILSNTNTSRRLIADNKDRLVPPLLKMTSDNIASRRDAKGTQNRYAAIQALGSIASCVNSALAGSVGVIMDAMIVNLILVLRERAQKPLSDASVQLLAERHYGGPAATGTQNPVLELPEKLEDVDVVYALACSRGIGAAAACATSADVQDLLRLVTALLDKQNGWTVPYVPSLVFSDIVAAMQRRPQQLGFSVYQCLCEVGQRNSDPGVRVGVLRALQACMDALPMTGGRPAVVLEYLTGVLALPLLATDAPADTETTRLRTDTQDAVARLTARLLRATYRQRNASQLQNIVSTLWELLEMDVKTNTGADASTPSARPLLQLVLRLVVLAAPYLRTIPLVDRKDMQVTEALTPYLNGSDDTLRHIAARVLTEVIAGQPEDGVETANHKTEKTTSAPAVAAAADKQWRSQPLPSRNGTLFTDERDVCFAQEWVKRVSVETSGITARCVVAVSDVLCALMAGYGVSGLPFNLTFLWSLQQRCVRADPNTSGVNSSVNNGRGGNVSPTTPMLGDDEASNCTSLRTITMLASRSATSQLTRAWLHMVAAVLITMGNVYGMANLVTYGMEVLRKRAALGQLAACFEPALRTPSKGSEMYTVSGLRYLASEKSHVLSAALTESPVSKLPSFSYVANIIVDADLPEVAAVFDANEHEELHTIIEDRCFQLGSEANVSLVSAMTGRDTSLSVSGGLRPPRFSLMVDDAAKVNALRALKISVIDNAMPRTQDSRGAVPLSDTATTTAQKVCEMAARFNVSAETQVLAPGVIAALPPLVMASPHGEAYVAEDDDDDVSGGASEVSDMVQHSLSNPNGQGHWTPRYSTSGMALTGLVNPLDVDFGIRTGRRSHARLSAVSLPAARYVTLE